MGGGFYSSVSKTTRDFDSGLYHKTAHQTFSRTFNSAMNPSGVRIRESRDSSDHPNSVPIVVGLDVTGSMYDIPHQLVKHGLPTMMDDIIQTGILDPQVLFLGIGDHECDRAPLQVGQFESSDELLDKWLTTTYLEGGGGGNDGESYLLAWYFAAKHTVLDSMEKRNTKGYLFTIGDEPTLGGISAKQIKDIMGEGQYRDYSAVELLSLAKKTYNVYHLHVKEGCNGRREPVMNGWKELMGDNLVIVDNKDDVARTMARIVGLGKRVSEQGDMINQDTVVDIPSDQVDIIL